MDIVAPRIDDAVLKRFKQPEHLLGPQICDICDRNISKSVKVICAVCGTPEAPFATDQQKESAEKTAPGSIKKELVMCLECLRLGKTSAEYPMHKADHAYYIIDNMDFPLLTSDWTAYQEVRLIQGIMKCGLGNWSEIAAQFLKGNTDGSGVKTKEECETHYYSVLMQQTDKI